MATGDNTGVYTSVQGLNKMVCHCIPGGDQERIKWYVSVRADYFQNLELY